MFDFEIINYFFENFWINIIDVILVALIYFSLSRLLKGNKAFDLIKSLMFILAFVMFAFTLHLKVLQALFKEFWSVGVLIIVIIFQPEIRRGLSNIGRNRFLRFINKDKEKVLEEVVRAVKKFSRLKIGALIVFENKNKLDEYIASGTQINASVSSDLIETIFIPGTPLHDGAIIIKSDVITAAACILPVSRDTELDKKFGTRHRAAIALSDETDAVVVVVSEETGSISIAVNGQLAYDIQVESLTDLFAIHLSEEYFRK